MMKCHALESLPSDRVSLEQGHCAVVAVLFLSLNSDYQRGNCPGESRATAGRGGPSASCSCIRGWPYPSRMIVGLG